MHFTKAAILGLATLAAAHPGHEEAEHRQAIAARANIQANKRALEGCAAKLDSRGVSARAIERRKATLAEHRRTKRIPVDGMFQSSHALPVSTLKRSSGNRGKHAS